MSPTFRRGGGGDRTFVAFNCGAYSYIIAFYWYQVFALDSVVVETQNDLARMEVS